MMWTLRPGQVPGKRFLTLPRQLFQTISPSWGLSVPDRGLQGERSHSQGTPPKELWTDPRLEQQDSGRSALCSGPWPGTSWALEGPQSQWPSPGWAWSVSGPVDAEQELGGISGDRGLTYPLCQEAELAGAASILGPWEGAGTTKGHHT